MLEERVVVDALLRRKPRQASRTLVEPSPREPRRVLPAAQDTPHRRNLGHAVTLGRKRRVHGLEPRRKTFTRARGRIAEVERKVERSWNNVGRARAGVNVRRLPRRRRKGFVALVPGHRRELGNRGCHPVDRIHGLVRIRDVTLDTTHPSLAGRRGDAILDGWIFASGTRVVACVWAGGNKVVEGGRHRLRQNALDAFKAAVRRLVA